MSQIIDRAEYFTRLFQWRGYREVQDESGNGHHGRWIFFSREQGDTFDGRGAHSERLIVPGNPGFDIGANDSFTVVMVFKTEVTARGWPALTLLQSFFKKWDTGEPGFKFEMKVSPNIAPSLLLDDGTDTVTVEDTSVDLFVADTLYYIAARLNRSDDTAEIFIDGVSIASGSTTTIDSLANNLEVRILDQDDTDLTTNVHAIGFWREALTDAEILTAGYELNGGWSYGWQHPDGYLDHSKMLQSGRNPVPDPGYGTLTFPYRYPMSSVMLNYAPNYMGQDPYLRDIADAVGHELSFLRLTMDKLLDNHFEAYAWNWGLDNIADDYGSFKYDKDLGTLHKRELESADIRARLQPHFTQLQLIDMLQDMAKGTVTLAVNFGATTTVDMAVHDGYRNVDIAQDEDDPIIVALTQALPAHIDLGTVTFPKVRPTQRHWRGRNDDGDETTATWKAAEDVPWSQAVDTNFRIRWQIIGRYHGTETGETDLNVEFHIQYRILKKGTGGHYEVGDWVIIDPADIKALVKPAASTQYVSPVDTTLQLESHGTAIYLVDNDGLIDSDLTAWDNESAWGDTGKLDFSDGVSTTDYFELEACLEIDADGTEVLIDADDKIQFRPVRANTSPGGNGATIPYFNRVRGDLDEGLRSYAILTVT